VYERREKRIRMQTLPGKKGGGKIYGQKADEGRDFA
jgi:hypothetical protein